METNTEPIHNLVAVLSKDIINVNTNTSAGQGAQTSVSVTVTNNGDSEVILKSVGILLPTTITTSPDTIIPKADTAIWSFKKSQSTTNQFDAVPSAGGTVTLAAQASVVFELNTIVLVNTVAPNP